MYWDVDGCGVVCSCVCCGDYRETTGDETTIEGEKERNEHR